MNDLAASPSVKPSEGSVVDTDSRLTAICKMLAVPVAAFVGGAWGHSFIRDKSYNNLRNRGAFQKEYDALNNATRELLPEWGQVKDITKDMQSLETAFSHKVDRRLHDLGYKNIFDRFKHLHRNQKFEAALTTFTAGGVALGVMLTIADHKSLFGRLSKADHDQKPSK